MVRDETRKRSDEIKKKMEFSINIGKTSVEILKVAKKEKVSLIVMGTHGMGRMEELLVGSVTEKVVRHSKTPVLVIRR